MDNGMPETERYRIPQLRRRAANGIRGYHCSDETFVKANESLPRPSVGFWRLSFEPDVKDSSGRTELDKVWTVVKELVTEGVLIQAGYCRKSDHHVEVDCQVRDYTDTEDVFESAARLREKIDYIYPMYMKTNTCRNANGAHLFGYMHCVDGDLYENTERGFKLLRRF